MSFLDDLAKGDVIRGTVKRYLGNHEPRDLDDERFFDFPDDSRWFGFVRADDGREFFFHFNQGLDLFYNIHLNITASANRRVPEPGDKIVFNTIVGKKSDKVRANNWVFADNLEEVQAAIAKYKKFRIIVKDSLPAKVVWEGAEHELSLKFREYVTAGIRTGDPTARGPELLFQRMLDGGEWTLWESHARLTALLTSTSYVRVIKTTTMNASGTSISKAIEVVEKDEYRRLLSDLERDSSDCSTFSIKYHSEWMDNQGNWNKLQVPTPVYCYAF
jgi:hypothetical protein